MAYTQLFFLSFTLLLTISSSHHLFPLTHSLSTTTFTSPTHLLKSTTALSAARHRRHLQKQVSLPLSPGTDYTLSFTLNSQTLSLYMDTGSDLVWFPCYPFECILCEGKYAPGTLSPLNITNSSRLPCKSSACSSAHNSLPSSDLCAMARCPLEDIETSDCSKFSCPPFYYAYGDGSLIAHLHKLQLVLPSSSNDRVYMKDFTFGCAHTTLGEPLGVAGFGRGALSLPAQLASVSPELGDQFSYCLVTHSFDSAKLRQPSPLILGKYDHQKRKDLEQSTIPISPYVYTPMLDNPKHKYFYTVGLEGISVGGRRIPTPENLRMVDGKGNGGVVIDSGTTYTMLPTELYNSIADELDRRVGKVWKRAKDTESRNGLSPCYGLHGKKGSVGLVVPSLVLHFGGNDSSVVLPKRNYFYEFMDGGDEGKKGKRVGCFMMMDGGDDSEGGPGITLGNYQQQGFEVVYDLAGKRVGFARRKCASLWENLKG